MQTTNRIGAIHQLNLGDVFLFAEIVMFENN